MTRRMTAAENVQFKPSLLYSKMALLRLPWTLLSFRLLTRLRARREAILLAEGEASEVGLRHDPEDAEGGAGGDPLFDASNGC